MRGGSDQAAPLPRRGLDRLAWARKGGRPRNQKMMRIQQATARSPACRPEREEIVGDDDVGRGRLAEGDARADGADDFKSCRVLRGPDDQAVRVVGLALDAREGDQLPWMPAGRREVGKPLDRISLIHEDAP